MATKVHVCRQHGPLVRVIEGSPARCPECQVEVSPRLLGPLVQRPVAEARSRLAVSRSLAVDPN